MREADEGVRGRRRGEEDRCCVDGLMKAGKKTGRYRKVPTGRRWVRGKVRRASTGKVGGAGEAGE